MATSRLFGELIPDPHIPEWLTAQAQPIPLLGGARCPIVYEDEDIAASDDALERFLALGPAQRAVAGVHVFRNYQMMAEAVGAEDVGCAIASPEAVWSCVTPTHVHVSRRGRDGRLYVSVAAECRWEPEHGLQIVYAGGDVLKRVSQQDGHLTYVEAYARPEAEDRIDG
jgi:hypothetical protein